MSQVGRFRGTFSNVVVLNKLTRLAIFGWYVESSREAGSPEPTVFHICFHSFSNKSRLDGSFIKIVEHQEKQTLEKVNRDKLTWRDKLILIN